MQQATVEYVDDIDGESAATETVPFALDGVDYTIDLNAERAADLREIFEPYKDRGRRVGGRHQRRALTPGHRVTVPVSAAGAPVVHGQSESARIRAWAPDHGFTVRPMGRIPALIVAAFRAAMAAPEPAAAKPAKKTSRGTRVTAARTGRGA